MNLRVITFIMHVSKSPLSKRVWTPTPTSGLISNCVTCTSGTLSFQLWIIHLTHITLPTSPYLKMQDLMRRLCHILVVIALLWRENLSQSCCFGEYGVYNFKMPAGCIRLCVKSHNFPCRFQPVNTSNHDSCWGFSMLTIDLKT